MEQPRVLVLSTTAYYRVKVEEGNVTAVKVSLGKMTRIEVSHGTVKVSAMEPVATAATGRWLSSATAIASVATSLWSEIRAGERQAATTDEFETTREYRPYAQILPAEATGTLAAALSKAAELADADERARGRAGFEWPRVVVG